MPARRWHDGLLKLQSGTLTLCNESSKLVRKTSKFDEGALGPSQTIMIDHFEVEVRRPSGPPRLYGSVTRAKSRSSRRKPKESTLALTSWSRTSDLQLLLGKNSNRLMGQTARRIVARLWQPSPFKPVFSILKPRGPSFFSTHQRQLWSLIRTYRALCESIRGRVCASCKLSAHSEGPRGKSVARYRMRVCRFDCVTQGL